MTYRTDGFVNAPGWNLSGSMRIFAPGCNIFVGGTGGYFLGNGLDKIYYA